MPAVEVAPQIGTEVRFKEFDVNVDGGNIHFLRAGNPTAPDVVLLHGALSTANLCFREMIDPIARAGFRVTVPDIPGYGKSFDPLEHSPDETARVMFEFMDAIGIAKAHVGGISYGGGTTMGMALQQPDRVESVGLINSIGFQDRVNIPRVDNIEVLNFFTGLLGKDRIASLVFNFPFLPQAVLGLKHLLGDNLTGTLVKEYVNRFVAHREYLKDEDRAEMLRDKHCITLFHWLADEMTPHGPRTNFLKRLDEIYFDHPAIIIQGGKDKLIDSRWGERAEKLILHSEYHVLEGSTHGSTAQNPKEVAALLGNFFSRNNRIESPANSS